jgi:hypothetical protein
LMQRVRDIVVVRVAGATERVAAPAE